MRFLRTKKPARVAERNIRISLSGHISRQRNVNKLEMRVRYRIVLRGISFRFFLKRKKWEKGKSEEGGWVQLKLSQIRLLINSFCLQLCHTHDFSLYFYVCDLLFFFSFVLLHVFFFFLRGKSNFFKYFLNTHSFHIYEVVYLLNL